MQEKVPGIVLEEDEEDKEEDGAGGGEGFRYGSGSLRGGSGDLVLFWQSS